MTIPWPIRRMWNACLDTLFPPQERCLLCGRGTRDGQAICQSCLQEIVHGPGPSCPRCGRSLASQPYLDGQPLHCPFCVGKPWAFSKARSIGPYDGALRLAVHRLKFRGQQNFGRILGDVLYRSADAEWWAGVDCIVPVPLHPDRLKQRGFNQAEIVAGQLATSADKPMRQILIRHVSTHPQTGLSQRQRQQNVQGAFCIALGQGRWVKGKRLLVVDDVMTTGSTLDACARVLLHAGAADVRVATLAITNLHGKDS